MSEAIDYFTGSELYLLANAFDGTVLFGLPEKAYYQLRGEEEFKQAHARLVEKGIITAETALTDAGALVIQALELYYKTIKYVRINNLMIAFDEENKNRCIVLSELEEGEVYRLRVTTKAYLLKALFGIFPLLLREPPKEEETFLKKELSYQDRLAVEEEYVDHTILNMESFHLTAKPQTMTNSAFYQQWLIFEKDENVIMSDVVQKKYYRASQYWLLKVLYDELEIPYKGAEWYERDRQRWQH
ncbi:hypothetical protein A374_18851 [Fictibacillus macauensis ZFHKF-1]|uniref:DUF5081 domain-containing protein n=1 Tax=Fictibacillus macauensis ZFHKF-1 TaxID=1196324 RepID=I8UAD9_9BACL|nr:DUF5081 family protein [Fictibacillus macauensis]EIT83778.1 hypothetical protein A374_18851 [Fictibacillus macauensis ZFHKF-1]